MAETDEARLAPLSELPTGVLLISEIFASIQGESTYAGRPCSFVRTSCCNNRCGYCDTKYALADAGYEVLLETNGSLDVGSVDPRVVKIVDLKAPSSGEEQDNRYANLELLTAQDEVKLVLADRRDYEWARELLTRHRLAERCDVLFGPVFGALEAATLAAWVLEDRLPVRMQLQLHKVIWGATARGV